MPRPLSNRYSDYDVPLTKEQRELRVRSGIVPDPNVPAIKEERLLKERLGNADASSLSSGSRPMSNASSVFSADASIISSSQSSSSGKLGPPAAEEESGRASPSSIDQQLEMISQMVGDVKSSVAAATATSSPSSDNLVPGIPRYLDEDGSSHSGSNDNLGVWDDVSSEPDSDENEGECGVCGCSTVMRGMMGLLGN